ncbi:suppressor of fused domain protein [Nonomuraea endophytica]|uniref:Suppressor of fused domain protein n=1 Tax=Nonomuraea endophytica TaxID=714136 RepID=A0A7W8A9C6_9ACTN|nr:suppressor of fused domain protein [Nonomuraea endophytica]MBB5082052.1 hypothetical protein [Nonomuraea endophytica]
MHGKIEAALEKVYGEAQPWGDLAGGAIRGYAAGLPLPHWHLITIGTGQGYELSLRVARGPADAAPPDWCVALLLDLREQPLAPGRLMRMHPRGSLTALALTVDPEFDVLDTLTFLQVAALTEAEYERARTGHVIPTLWRIGQDVPLHIIDPAQR